MAALVFASFLFGLPDAGWYSTLFTITLIKKIRKWGGPFSETNSKAGVGHFLILQYSIKILIGCLLSGRLKNN